MFCFVSKHGRDYCWISRAVRNGIFRYTFKDKSFFWMIRGSILAKVVVLVILFDNETLCFKDQINFICKALLTA